MDVAVAPRKQLARRHVAFFTKVDSARDVILTGDFTGWATDRIHLRPTANGGWSGTLELAQGDHEYRLIIDGEWKDDDQNLVRVPNGFGTQNCVLKVK